MTKFRNMNMNPASNIFVEVMNNRDKNSFNTAFSRKPNAHLDRNLPIHRRWVRDVIECWGRAVPINNALAWQVITTGDYRAVRRHYGRIHESLMTDRMELLRQEDNQLRAQKLKVMEAAITEAKGITDLDDAALAAWLRSHWVDCLTIAHPSTPRNEFTGKVQPGKSAAKTAKKIVEATTKPNKSKGKRTATAAATAA